MRIVIVDPDVKFRQALISQLRRRKYDVIGVGDAASLYRDLLTRPCDAVIIDPALPGEDGYTVAGFLSSLKRARIVMLCDPDTAARSDVCPTDAISAFLPKPFALRELIATIDRIDPRSGTRAPREPAQDSMPGLWMLVRQGWQLIAPTGASIRLTSYEYSLMHLLFERQGAVVSRLEIVSTFGLDFRLYDERRLESIVSRLRRKLSPHQGASKPLQTAHGFGYAFTAPVKIESGSASNTAMPPPDASQEEDASVPASAHGVTHSTSNAS
jgi:DNA-binding response OmpR family regulator